MAEVLDIVVRQRGARRVAKDIATIGVSATSASAALKKMQLTLRQTGLAFTQASAGSQKFAAQCQKTTRCTQQAAAASAKGTKAMGNFGAGAAVAGAAITAGFTAPLLGAIRSAADFEQAMNLTAVLLQVDRASEAFKDLENVALELGRTTQFTAVQAAEGLSFLAKAGFETQEAVAAIPETLKIAAAANIDLGTAADVTTNILKGFRLEVEELPQAVDILAATFSNSNTDLLELSASFKKVGPVAAEFNQRFQDVAAVLGALGDAGVKAEESGTALRRIFINLQQDAGKANSILKKFGITIRDEVTGEFRPLIDIFKEVAAAPIEPTQKIDLFGARALAAAGILTNASGDLQGFADTVANSVGRAAEIGAARLFGFNGASVQLASALEGLGIAIAKSGLLDFLTLLIQGTTAAVRALTSLPKPVVALIGALASFLAIAGPVLVTVGLLSFGLGALGLSLGGVAVAVGGFLLAIAPVVAVVAALVAGFVLLKDVQFDLGGSTVTLGALISETWESIKSAVQTAVDVALVAFELLKFGVVLLIESFGGLERITDSLPSFSEFAASVIASFEIVGRTIFAFIARVIDGLIQFARDVGSIGTTIGKAIKAAIDFDDATDAGEILGQGLRVGFLDSFDGFGAEVKGIVEDATGKAEAALGALGRSDFVQRAAARTAAPGAPAPGAPGAPAPVPDPGPTNRFTEAQLKALGAVNQLTASFTPGSAAVMRMNQTLEVLSNAVDENAISADTARTIFAQLRMDAGDEFLASIDPVTAALREQTTALAELEVVSSLFGLTQEQTALAQETIIEQTNERLLQLEQFKEGLTGIQSVQLGVTEGIRQFAEDTGTQFDIVKAGVTSLASTMSQQLTKAVQDGEFSFQQFASSVVSAIQEIIVQLLIQIALQAALKAIGGGGIPGAAQGATITAAQDGASTGGAVGQAFLVGEQGPELFKPQQTGEIIPNAETAAMLGGGGAPPQVNVQVVNVDDNSNVPDAMSTREGEQVILNTIQRNKNLLREVIA